VKKHDALWAAVAAKFEAAILVAGSSPEEHAAVFEELVSTYCALHRTRDPDKARALAVEVVRLMARFELRPGQRGITPINASLDELLNEDTFRVLPREAAELWSGLYGPR
jgi:hypothetical protein